MFCSFKIQTKRFIFYTTDVLLKIIPQNLTNKNLKNISKVKILGTTVKKNFLLTLKIKNENSLSYIKCYPTHNNVKNIVVSNSICKY